MVKHTLLVLQFTWRVKQTTGQYWIQTCISGPQIIPRSKVPLLYWWNISHSIKYVQQAPSCPWVYSGLYGGMCHNPPIEFLLDLFFNCHWLGQVWTICRLPCINLAVDRLSHNSSPLLNIMMFVKNSWNIAAVEFFLPNILVWESNWILGLILGMTTNSETIKQCLSSINLVKLAPRHHDLAPRHQDRVCENNWAFLVSEPVTKHYTVTRAIAYYHPKCTLTNWNRTCT